MGVIKKSITWCIPKNMTMENFRPVDGTVASLANGNKIIKNEKPTITGIELFDSALSNNDLTLLDAAVNRHKELQSLAVVENMLSSATKEDMQVLTAKVKDLQYCVDEVAKKSVIADILEYINEM